MELEPELVLLQLSLERQQTADVEELQRCIDEVQPHYNYLLTYQTHLIHRFGACRLLLLCCSWSKASRQCQGKCEMTTSSKDW